MERTDFTIIFKPSHISFECPHCGCDAAIQWRDLCVPEYWGDEWGVVVCPYCNKEVELGDYDYD